MSSIREICRAVEIAGTMCDSKSRSCTFAFSAIQSLHFIAHPNTWRWTGLDFRFDVYLQIYLSKANHPGRENESNSMMPSER